MSRPPLQQSLTDYLFQLKITDLSKEYFQQSILNLFFPFRELEEARVQQKNSPQRKIGLGSQTRNSRVIGQKVNRSMSLSVIM